MSRYIDADALKKRVSELIIPDWTRTLIRSWLDSAPTVDAVPVVRCKACLHHTEVQPYDEEDELITSNAVFCQHFEVIRNKNWFCADGKRRGDGKQ